jgi:hypothetical protein
MLKITFDRIYFSNIDLKMTKIQKILLRSFAARRRGERANLSHRDGIRRREEKRPCAVL